MFRERGYLPDNGGAALLELIERGSHGCNDICLNRLVKLDSGGAKS